MKRYDALDVAIAALVISAVAGLYSAHWLVGVVGSFAAAWGLLEGCE